jgi:hypothetical protein
MNARPSAGSTVSPRKGVTPFTVFGIVAAFAAAGAIWEMSYYAGSSVFSADALGTTLGVVVATAIFFILGARASPNE